MVEQLTSSSGHQTHFRIIKEVLSIHSKGLSTASLTVSEYRSIIAAHYVVYHLLAHEIKDLLLSAVWPENMIESEHQIAAMRKELLLHFNGLSIFIKADDIRAFRGIHLL